MQRTSWANYLFAFAVLVVCSLLLSCGGSSKPKPLSVTLSPSSAAISVNASVAIAAQTNPMLQKYTGVMTWSIQEYQSSTRCIEQVSEPGVSHPIDNCPYGWLEFTNPQTGYTTTNLVYYSPETAGTWHVNADAVITNNGTTQYQGNASATITVTNP